MSLKGFGMADLLGSRSNKEVSKNRVKDEASNVSIIEIDPNLCDECDWQPRSFIKEDKIISMMQSIDSEGQHEPIIVYINGDAQQDYSNNRYIIVSGHTRVEACKRLEKRVLARIYLSPKKSDIAAFSTNVIKDDLHPVDFGARLKKYFEEGIFSNQEEACTYLGKTQGLISRYLSYGYIPREIRSLIVEGDIYSTSILKKIAKMFKEIEKGKSSYSIQEAIFLSEETIEEFLNKKNVTTSKKDKVKGVVEKKNFIVLENEEDFVLRLNSIKSLSQEKREEFVKACKEAILFAENISL